MSIPQVNMLRTSQQADFAIERNSQLSRGRKERLPAIIKVAPKTGPMAEMSKQIIL